MTEQTKSSWDQTWEDVFQNNEWGKYPDESFIRFVARNFYKKDRASTKLLELGCGPGANIWYLSREGFCVFGIDGSSTAIQKAEQRLDDENLHANLLVGDIVDLPFEDQQFDAVADNECFAHNSRENIERILQEAKRVLKKDGLIYSRTFTDDVYIGEKQTEVGDLEYKDVSDGPFGGRGFIRLVRREDIESIYGKYFTIQSVDRMDYSINNGTLKISEWVIMGKNE